MEATRGLSGAEKILTEGFLTYLTARLPGGETSIRKALAWVGGLMLIPFTVAVVASSLFSHGRQGALPEIYRSFGWFMALLLPLSLAWWLR